MKRIKINFKLHLKINNTFQSTQIFTEREKHKYVKNKQFCTVTQNDNNNNNNNNKNNNNNDNNKTKTKKTSKQIREMVPWIPDEEKLFQNVCTF